MTKISKGKRRHLIAACERIELQHRRARLKFDLRLLDNVSRAASAAVKAFSALLAEHSAEMVRILAASNREPSGLYSHALPFSFAASPSAPLASEIHAVPYVSAEEADAAERRRVAP